MTKPPTTHNCVTKQTGSQDTPPFVNQLKAVFQVIPDEVLLRTLKTYYAGRQGYTYTVLWQTYIAMVMMNIPSFAALIRALCDNPYLAEACGISSQDGVPSKFAYSRFMHKLQTGKNVVLVKNIMRTLNLRCYDKFPNFAKSVAIDATDLKAWSNGGKKVKSDPDAGWIIKADTSGKKKFVYGYKMHLMVDTTYEIPLIANITKGNVADVNNATPLLSQARYVSGKFQPDHIICDAGYSSAKLRRVIKRQWHAMPVIRAPKSHKKWLDQETSEWKAIFNRRVAVERVFGRMKDHRRLNNITVRHRRKLTVHSLIPIIVTQASALAFPDTPRRCTFQDIRYY